MRLVSELPTAARSFVQLVEAEVGVPVNIVGVGAERDDVFTWTTGAIRA